MVAANQRVWHWHIFYRFLGQKTKFLKGVHISKKIENIKFMFGMKNWPRMQISITCWNFAAALSFTELGTLTISFFSKTPVKVDLKQILSERNITDVFCIKISYVHVKWFIFYKNLKWQLISLKNAYFLLQCHDLDSLICSHL